MRLRNVVAGSLVAAVGVVGAAPSASAETVEIRDKAGDAPARFDLTTVAVSNGPEGLSLRADVRRLKGGGAQILVVNVTAAGGGYPAYYLATIRRADGSVVTKMSRTDENGFEYLDCDISSKWRLKRSRVRMSVPHTCADEERAVSVNVAIGSGNGSSGDPADWTRSFRVAFG